MHGVGPGSTLGGRYALARRLQEHSRYERWLAHDQTLERDVVLLCFPVQGETAAAGLDAARRAAGIEEARLVRVLDVGRDGETAFVVEEPLTRAVDLVDLLDGGPLPASEARRLVGEAATALDRAGVRGLHHGVLGPRSLLRLDDGSVKVRGLAVEGALLGLDDVDGAQASRDDTVALVALAYAALTGHWPLTAPVGPHDGLPAAPTVVGGIASASEITAGVPADLDTIARLTLGTPGSVRSAQGPLTPGDLARQIAPWPSVADPAHLSLPVPADSGSRTVRVSASAAAPQTAPTTTATDAAAGRTTSLPVAATSGAAVSSASTAGATVLGMPIGATRTTAAGAPARGPDTDSLDLRSLSARDEPAARGTTPEAPVTPDTPRALESDDTDPRDDDGWDETDGADDTPYGRGTASGTGGPSLVKGRDPLRMTAHVRLSDTLEESDDDLEPPLPLPLGGSRNAAPSGDHTGTALAAVAALVVVAAVLGIFGVSRIGSSSTPAPAAVTTTAAATATTPAPTSSASPTSSGPVGALTPIGIVQAQAWDPEGDNQEGNASSPRSFDGDPSTLWRSQTYQSAPFGGFAKSGIGLILDLGQQQTVRQVQVDLRGGSDLTVYVASRESLEGATSIGTSSGVDGTVTVTAPGSGARGQLVILWFTRLAPDGEGGFRAQVAEARVSG